MDNLNAITMELQLVLALSSYVKIIGLFSFFYHIKPPTVPGTISRSPHLLSISTSVTPGIDFSIFLWWIHTHLL